MVEVQVDYDYIAEQDDELSIKVGDIVKNVVRSEGGWWEGELNGKKGLFPDNFVKVIKDPEKDAKKEDPLKRNQKGGSVRELANKLKEGVVIGGAPQKKKEPKKYAKAEFSYEPDNDDELKMEVGDVIEILKQEEEGWWEGSLNGQVGVFPSNFVKIIEESELENGEDKEKGEAPPKVKKVKGIGLGNIFEGGPIKLRSTGTGSSSKKTTGQAVTQDGKPDTPEPPVVALREKKNVDKAVVRFSYAAENEDELSLREGDIINILDKELEDAGWWKGEIDGKVGVFPDNFVEAMEITEEVKGKKTPIPAAKQPPKLPDKGPVADSSKPPDHTDKHVRPTDHTDKHVRKKEDPPASEKNPPTIPGKRPLPPPVKRKPTNPPKHQGDKNTSTAVTNSTKDEHRAATPPLKDEKKNDAGFDSVETNEKLTHLTQARPKGPSKRPPSQVMLHNEEVQNGDIKESLKEDTTGHRNPITTKSKRDEHHADRKSVLEPVREKGHHGPARPPDPALGATVHSSIEEFRRELRELKANTVSKAAYDELKLENERLKHDIESMKTSYSKRFRELFEELDEEKKIRLSTQVEMERIRKIVSESHV